MERNTRTCSQSSNKIKQKDDSDEEEIDNFSLEEFPATAKPISVTSDKEAKKSAKSPSYDE